VALLSHHEFLEQGAADLPQVDELCGPFWASAALRTAGFEVTQEEAALTAGSVLQPPGAPSSLPPGESGRRPATELPTGDPAGTSAHGVARAIEELSGGALVAVPASGPWTAERLVELLDGLEDPVVIANVDTSPLWSQASAPASLVEYLRTGADAGEDNDWRVGHFVAVSGVVRGPRAVAVALVDSYETRRSHIHPAARVAAALAGRGLLIVTEEPEDVHEHVVEVGLRPDLWDNGSPQP
jgi:hypothetical protein